MKLLIIAGVPLFMFYRGVITGHSFWSLIMPGWAANIVSIISCLTVAMILAWISTSNEDGK